MGPGKGSSPGTPWKRYIPGMWEVLTSRRKRDPTHLYMCLLHFTDAAWTGERIRVGKPYHRQSWSDTSVLGPGEGEKAVLTCSPWVPGRNVPAPSNKHIPARVTWEEDSWDHNLLTIQLFLFPLTFILYFFFFPFYFFLCGTSMDPNQPSNFLMVSINWLFIFLVEV